MDTCLADDNELSETPMLNFIQSVEKGRLQAGTTVCGAPHAFQNRRERRISEDVLIDDYGGGSGGHAPLQP
jgi:hypothetical protein